MELQEEDLLHYGIIRRSGRYPWGSGGNVGDSPIHSARNKQFLDYVKDLERTGMTESQIAQGFGLTTTQLRARRSIATNQRRAAQVGWVTRLKNKGMSIIGISQRTGLPESTVRSYLKPGAAEKADILTNVTKTLKKAVDEKGMIDVSKGVELHIPSPNSDPLAAHLGVSRTKLDTAIEVLKQAGYKLHLIKAPQATTGHDTYTKVLAKPGTEWAYVINNQDKIHHITDFSDDGGRTMGTLHDPLQLSADRVQVVYNSEGGGKADGMIYVRPGVDDVSIGGSRYAQVRVAVGPDHFIKGMALYKGDLPEGVDVQFHTNKDSTGNKLDALKKNTEEKGYIEGGPHVLLKSIRRQIVANPDTPGEHVTSVMNIVDEEGKWAEWSESMSSQMLSKQSPKLAKAQLDKTYERRLSEYEDIMALTNPTVRKKLLQEFADSTDAAAVDLKAAALPRTANHVILPLASIKPTEIYAPNFNQGEKVVLIRHPHGGVFEIPELVVNNNQREGKKLLGNSRDAVGIHHSVASWLSGADFDGDTVLVIPNNAERIKHSKALDQLKDFDPRADYKGYPGMKRMKNTQAEMGSVSNLITDMSLQNAPHSEIARAVRHSMVVIDAEKHNLNYKQSEIDNGIQQLKKKYQTGGASTIISRAQADKFIPQQKPRTRPHGGPINTKTGALEFEPTGKVSYKTGKPVQQRIKRLADERDATKLLSKARTPMERIYADHSNRLKGLANKARLSMIKTPNLRVSTSAKKTYAKEVASLKSKLALAQRNAPLERQAQRIADATAKMRKQSNPDIERDTLKKIKYQALVQARKRTGADKQRIKFTHAEWDAIQAGAISNSNLREMLNHADMETVRSLATPKRAVLMTPSKTNRAKALLSSGKTRAEVAKIMGVSLSTLDLATNG